MNVFLQRAQQLLDTAQSGPATVEMTVLIAPDGALQLCADSDWPLDSLARERGAHSAYRVTAHNGRVRVEGRQGLTRCLLESPSTGASVSKALPNPSGSGPSAPWFPAPAWL